jgi:hypothetical protein
MTFIKPDATVSFTSRMEDNIQWACVQAGQFPRVGLMELSVCHGIWMTMGMGGMSPIPRGMGFEACLELAKSVVLCWLWSLIIFLIHRSLFSAMFIPHE